jgi:hypothetical protein
MSKLERPVCGECAREMTCEKNSFVINNQAGTLSWDTDLYRCLTCNVSVAVGSSDSYKPTGQTPHLRLIEGGS